MPAIIYQGDELPAEPCRFCGGLIHPPAALRRHEERHREIRRRLVVSARSMGELEHLDTEPTVRNGLEKTENVFDRTGVRVSLQHRGEQA